MFDCPLITIIACETLLQEKERVEHSLKVGLANDSKFGDYFYNGGFV